MATKPSNNSTRKPSTSTPAMPEREKGIGQDSADRITPRGGRIRDHQTVKNSLPPPPRPKK